MPVVIPTPSLTSPNVGNLSVKRGYFAAQFAGEDTFTDMGYCLSAELTMQPTLLHYYSPRDGVKKKVLSVVTQLDATLTMVLNEETARNLGIQLLALGTAGESPAGSRLEFMSYPRFYASLQFTDTSAYGPQWNAYFPLVLFTPKQALSLIAQGSGDWAQISITCDVQYDETTLSFGYMESTMEHTA
jgi:hypothetical protein